MARHTYNKEITALLVIDPYNDFIPRQARYGQHSSCCRSGLLGSSYAAGPECRAEAKLRVFYTLHHRYRPGDYKTWEYIAPVQKVA
jgi:ureidoacrylate peracid hydrolase